MVVCSYSFMPIDLGFDPRAHGMAVLLPEDAREVRYPDPSGEEVCLRSESWLDLLHALAGAGFRVLTVGDPAERGEV